MYKNINQKGSFMKKTILLGLLGLGLLYGDAFRQTTKTSCIQQSEYGGKSLDEQKKILIEQAKQEALEELYGTLMFSATDLTNGKITNDEIRSRAVGAVRVSGNPKFYNGANFGEICSDVSTYITQEDMERYSPQEVRLERFCFSDPNTPVNKIKPLAKKKAYIEAITQYKPSLKNLTMEQAEKLIHGFKLTNDNFDFGTGAYCFDAVATLLPYELEMSNVKKLGNAQTIEFDESKLQKGLKAIFYAEDDFDMSKPLYSEVVPTLNLAYRKYPSVDEITKNKPYIVIITGYIKLGADISSNLQMFAQVYKASLKIDEKEIATDKKNKTSLDLSKGYHKIDLVIKSANSYDTRIVANGLEYLYHLAN